MLHSLDRISVRQVLLASIGLVAILLAIGLATRENVADKPYLTIAGSSFIFNYRVADACYGFTPSSRSRCGTIRARLAPPRALRYRHSVRADTLGGSAELSGLVGFCRRVRFSSFRTRRPRDHLANKRI